jgi:hypothetical protein
MFVADDLLASLVDGRLKTVVGFAEVVCHSGYTKMAKKPGEVIHCKAEETKPR